MDNGGCETFVADCRLRQATELIAHTWDPLVLMALRRGATRRRDLLSESAASATRCSARP